MFHRGVSAREARDRAIEMMRLVQIPEAPTRLRQYPHQLSGGMRQRVATGAITSDDVRAAKCRRRSRSRW